MSLIQNLNSKSNVKIKTTNDLPINVQQPVLNSYVAVSTASQTVINLGFLVQTTGLSANTDAFFLFVDGKKLTLGALNDYTFTSVGSDGSSSQVTLTQSLSAGLNLQAYTLGYRAESGYTTDNRFVQLYAAQNAGFQPFVSQTDNVITATTATGTPAAGTFYSSIIGRSSMPDMSQDLKPRMGIERIPALAFQQLQNEFGSSGEPVYSVLNDVDNRIRFIGGGWSQTNASSSGQYISTSTVGDSLEVTFYGTGLNLLSFSFGANRSSTITVDGVSSGTFTQTTTSNSAVLTSRNYSMNAVMPVVSGLTLGTHTVRLVVVTQLDILGFEILNVNATPTQISTNPGISYNSGKKLTTSAQSLLAYNAPVTGTRGGRVLMYQNADGTIAQAFQAVDAAQANLTSATHVNEEVARVYHPREFGAGRSDDFSTFIHGTFATIGSTLAFTLDDGTTTLINSSGGFVSGLSKEAVAVRCNGTAQFMTITFVGTGLDLELVIDGTTRQFDTVQIDGGTTIGALSKTASTAVETRKIVSGLPYGTHTIKLGISGVQSSVAVSKIITYQPKKPTLPSGAVELADYNVMADFVAGTVAGVGTVATGVLRKHASRENVYVNGTGGTTDWTISASPSVVSVIGGFQTYSDRTNAYVEYTFFGTGVELRFGGAANRSASINVSIDGLAATVANYPSLVSSVYGTGVAFSSGVLDQADAVGSDGSGVRINGLTLGRHTIKLLNNTASSYLVVEAIDIITPIHSHRSNLTADLQNTLTVGSQGISDNRKTTPVKEALPVQKAWAQAIGLGSTLSTNVTSYVPMPEMSLTLKTNGGPIRVDFAHETHCAAANQSMYTVIFVDGKQVGQETVVTEEDASVYYDWTSCFATVPVSAGVHKIDLYWKVDAGTGFCNRRIIEAREL